jgi:hypothetical protein
VEILVSLDRGRHHVMVDLDLGSTSLRDFEEFLRLKYGIYANASVVLNKGIAILLYFLRGIVRFRNQ